MDVDVGAVQLGDGGGGLTNVLCLQLLHRLVQDVTLTGDAMHCGKRSHGVVSRQLKDDEV